MTQMKWLTATAVTGIALMGVGGNYFARVDAQSPHPVKTAAANPGPGEVPAHRLQDLARADLVRENYGFTSTSETKVHYEFVQFPNSNELKERFETVLIEAGQRGWDYVGITPTGTKMIFKKVQQVSTFPLNASIHNGLTRVPTSASELPLRSTAPSPNPVRTPTHEETRAHPVDPGVISGKGPIGGFQDQFVPFKNTLQTEVSSLESPTRGFLGNAAKRDPALISLRVGEMMRLSYATDIAKIYALNPKIVEVSLDPSNPKRVILKGLTKGESQLDVTSDGTDESIRLEVFTIKVK